MSGIDANFAGPFLQAPQASQQAAHARETEFNRAERIRRETAKIDDQRDTTIDETDENALVDNEAEGKGSQGRPFEDAAADTTEDPPADTAGITVDDAGRPHLDLEA